jgi:hypothetical protein
VAFTPSNENSRFGYFRGNVSFSACVVGFKQHGFDGVHGRPALHRFF